MNINDLKVDKLVLFILSTMIIIVFIDYSFNISIILSKLYNIDTDVIKRDNLYMLVGLLFFPILYFIGEFSFNGKSDILTTSIIPSVSFILGYYLFKINILSDIERMFIIMCIQLISQLTFLMLVKVLLSKLIKVFIDLNNKLSNEKEKEKDEVVELLKIKGLSNEEIVKVKKYL